MKTILYIGGSGRSGSTLLDMILNGFPEFVSLGEVHRLGYYVKRDEICTCGEKFSDCEFWQSVINNISKYSLDLSETLESDMKCIALSDDDSGIIKRFAERISLIVMPSALAKPLCKFVFSHNYKKIQRSIGLYECVSDISRARIVVDNTKDARRMKYLHTIEPNRTKFIYLVRDGRAVCFSAMKRKNISMHKAALTWAIAQIKQIIVLLTIPKNQRLIIKYEDLCTKQQTVLDELFEFLQIKNTSRFIALDRSSSHGLGGNPMRFRRDEKCIKLDEKWKLDLSERDKKSFSFLAGWLNRSLGY